MKLKKALQIHSILIDNFGGSHGVRDQGLLESALFRPFATFDGVDLYPTIVEKAAAILESVIINHPFIDGNKRTAYVLMRIMLMEAGVDVVATQDEKYNFVIGVTTGKHTIDFIKNWINEHLTK